jgi:single-strand DNA-binding protein
VAGSINRVILIGNVGKDPEIRSLNGGNRVASFSLATSDTWKDKQSGDRKEKSEWHNVVCFNEHIVKVVENYVRKGTKLYLEGKIQTRKWTDKDGKDRYTTEIVLENFRGELQLLDSKRDSEDRSERSGGGSAPMAGNPLAGEDDPIPFMCEWR